MPILTPEERLGQRIAGRYRLDTVLFTGGMGILFQASDEVTGDLVVVKMLKPAYSLDEDRVARFLRETRIAAAIRHPNIAAVLDVGQDDTGVPFLVIELLQGRSLQQELDIRHVLPLAEALEIVLPIAGALGAAHAAGVIHRDVKPGNIFVGRDVPGSVVSKLLDFGIAKSPKDDFETDTGLVMGTPGYMAPEQAHHGQCGPFTDIWAVGAVLYRCLSGNTPHSGGSIPESLGKLVREPVPPLVVPDVKKAVCATIDRALAQDPHRRYSSMAAFARALAAAASSDGKEGATDAMPAVAREPAEMERVSGGSRGGVSEDYRPTQSGAPSYWRGVGIVASAVALLTFLFVERARPHRPPSADKTLGRVSAAEVPPRPALPVAGAGLAKARDPDADPGAPDLRAGNGATRPASLKPPTLSHRPSSKAAIIPDPLPVSRPVEREPTTGLPVATEW